MNKPKILVIDDDLELLDELKTILESEEYSVDVVSQASSAVKDADELRPDLILLDLKMPGKSGFQIADDLKHFPGTSQIPLIAMTGYYTEQQHKKFMRSIGIADCILKPFEPSDILSKIRMYTVKQEYGCIENKRPTPLHG